MCKIRTGNVIIIAVILTVLFSSCEKQEQPVTLPPKGAASFDRVEMGEDYRDQVFYDLETGKIVKTSEVNSWDLAFESGASDYHIFMNGGKGDLVFPTGKSSFSLVSSATVDTSKVQTENHWKYDGASGLPAETGIGEWRDGNGISQNEVFVITLGAGKYYKFKLTFVDAKEYQMEFGALDDNEPQKIHIKKDNNYNYSYFSFTNGDHIVTPEPAKDSWDIVFTRYRYIYKDLQNFKYIVTGVLLNPYKTTCAEDSTMGFNGISLSTLPAMTFYPNRDVIGFDWKSFDYKTPGATYVVNQNKTYVIKNRKSQTWKIHFLDFKSPTKVKGSPSFEFIRMD